MTSIAIISVVVVAIGIVGLVVWNKRRKETVAAVPPQSEEQTSEGEAQKMTGVSFKDKQPPKDIYPLW